MSRRLTLALLFLFAFCLSITGVFAQETENPFPGEDEVITFYQNLGINGQIVYSNHSTNFQNGEPNWCYEGQRWGNGRCEFENPLFTEYAWRLGWILAHCEIPGYFTPENRPEECSLLRDNRVNVVFGVSSSSGSSGTSGGSTGTGSTPSNAAPTAAFSYTCTDLVCSFNGMGSSDSDGTIATYNWNFDDSQTGIGSSLVHTFAADGTYSVTLTVTDDDGATATTSQSVTVSDGTSGDGDSNVSPTAAFSVSCTDLDCTFDASSSSDSDGTITSYSWSFGGSGISPSHSFGSSGDYTVTLTVTDNEGATGTSSQTINVTEPVIITNNPPTASFSYACSDLDCTFDASGSSDSDGTITSYSWSFGGPGVNASHSFGSGGTYNVTLTVTDDDGDSATSSADITVTEPAPPGDIDLVATYTCSGSDIIVNIVSGDAPFTISGGGPSVDAATTGTYNIGARNGNIKVTEGGGDEEEVSVGTNIC